jgi:ribonuclease VapC
MGMNIKDPAVHAMARERAELHVHWALEGWRRYGKGRHRAGLNLGDCFSYGLAKVLNAPLLFKGDDFAATDVLAALPS